MSSDVETVLREMLRARPEVECGVIFGSTAIGRAGAGSDVDVYLRLSPGTRLSLATRLDLAAELSRRLRREVDLVVEDDTTSVILRREVARTGRPVYESRPGAWTDLAAAASLAYSDLEPLLRRMGAAVLSAARSSS